NATYTNSTFNKIPVNGVETIIDFDSKLNFNKYGLFIQGSKTLLEERLTLSAGLRTDWNDYSSEMSNPINQISPRFSAAYSFAPKWSLNFNTGRYYQLPAYTIMGFRNNNDELVNKDLGLKYISVDHVVGGIEYNSSRNRKITIEAFYKNYQNYPFSLRDSLSLANLGADFGVIGNEAITSSSEGRAYGLELLVQQKIFKGFYGILAYTLMKSEFTDKTGEFKPSAWDFGNIVNLTAGKKFKKDWEIGIRFRYSGGAPYTPFNNNISSLRASWDLIGVGVLDYNALNTLRLASNNQMDVRVDKKWFFNKWALNIYLDIQNVYAGQIEDRPFLDVLRDANGNPLVDPNDPSRYQVQLIENSSGTVLPTIGLQIDW
ncbi:MAG: TonB-dependent receptor, partial [Flavobacteriales bacterium]|nr:TonB-dependent receptor [Flavobacteriales bacterium]